MPSQPEFSRRSIKSASINSVLPIAYFNLDRQTYETIILTKQFNKNGRFVYLKRRILRQRQTEETSSGNGQIVIRIFHRVGRRSGQLERHGKLTGGSRQSRTTRTEINEIRFLFGGQGFQRLPEILNMTTKKEIGFQENYNNKTKLENRKNDDLHIIWSHRFIFRCLLQDFQIHGILSTEESFRFFGSEDR
jgi:hypothetical protein